MKKTLLLCLLLVCAAWCADGQVPADGKWYGVYRMYDFPAYEKVRAPKGYRPVAISHYSRHGARYQDSDAILLVYSARGMNEFPGDFEGDTLQYAANIPAGVYTAFGGSKPTAKLPVSIPKLDASYKYTDETLYQRGFGLSW